MTASLLTMTLFVGVAPAGDAPADGSGEQEIPSQPEAEPEPAADPGYEKARDLFMRGVAHYDTGNFGEAIDLWMEAYTTLPSKFEYRQIKAELTYNVARAQEKWFEIDGDIRHLKQARTAIESFIREIPDIYPDQQAGLERGKAEDVLAALDESIRAAQEAERQRELEEAERMRPRIDPVVDARERKRNRGMIASGSVLTVVGLGGIGLMVAGIATARDAEARLEELHLLDDADARRAELVRGQSADTMMFLGVITAGVGMLTGIPLTITGAVFEKRRKDYVESMQPTVLRGGFGLQVRGRF